VPHQSTGADVLVNYPPVGSEEATRWCVEAAVVDAAGACELAIHHGLSGSPEGAGVYFMKSPASQFADDDAGRLTEEFISRYGRGSAEPSERPAAAAQD
jgi:hypothetical protein